MSIRDSIPSPLCTQLELSAPQKINISDLNFPGMSDSMALARQLFPRGDCVFYGIPFNTGEEIILCHGDSVRVEVMGETKHCPFLVFLHVTDEKQPMASTDGILSPMRGRPILGDLVGSYTLKSSSGKEFVCDLKRRFNIGEITRTWGEENFSCLPHIKAKVRMPESESIYGVGRQVSSWGFSQTRVTGHGSNNGNLYLHTVANPFIEENIRYIDIRPVNCGVVLLSAVTACRLSSDPLMWEQRKKACIKFSEVNSVDFSDKLMMDLGTIISINPAVDYGHESWETRYNNRLPDSCRNRVIVEYTSHPEAILSFGDGTAIPVGKLSTDPVTVKGITCVQVPEARHDVLIRILDGETGSPTPVKFHVHGQAGEYLAPRDRHRYPNTNWFEDYSVDFVHKGSDTRHNCTYINGETVIALPLGRVYFEISKGYEIKPLHVSYDITEQTDEIVISLEKVLRWREKGWVTADTHVHFLSPCSALLEGGGEGVNIINLLASQWGELFTNIGDFDGKTTLEDKSGEHMVRVGTENRQHVMGHISLLGYEGKIILPLTTGGPDESAMGDGIECCLSQWARQAQEQNGIVIIPHFPNPRAENAAAIALERVDGVEMTSWGNLYGGISPYSLSDWYRYLNCGYNIPAVGGTDKMTANTAVGAIRTYSLIKDAVLAYDSWKNSIRSGNTFVTYGPLLDFHVNGTGMGGEIKLPASGGTLDIDWIVATCTVPVTKIELVVNGEIRGEKVIGLSEGECSGCFAFKTQESCWAALRVRGCYTGKEEVILAHSSAVMVRVEGRPCCKAPDAISILEQIEGVTAYVSSMGTKANDRKFKAVLAELMAAHRALHNRMHQNGIYHGHTPVDDHDEHYNEAIKISPLL